MRLLNTDTIELEEFFSTADNTIPSYAILSHTWGKGEVTAQDLRSGRCTGLQGYTKIVQCCKKAKSEGYNYVWIDTCCIDKTSSAELSEAINSMFRWYRDADICYAYLADVDSNTYPGTNSDFGKSSWFTRGWTLQELLAPSEVAFLAKDWQEIGTKLSLSRTVSRICGIDEIVLKSCSWDSFSIAQRFSWASSRRTTRLEDQAYCLLGLFDVNMPLLYGEGSRAFYRLQLEILKATDDHSIFAWSITEYQFRDWKHSGLLAPSPKCFGNSREIEAIETTQNVQGDTTAPSMTCEVTKDFVRLQVPSGSWRVMEATRNGGEKPVRSLIQIPTRLPQVPQPQTVMALGDLLSESYDGTIAAVLACKDAQNNRVTILLSKRETGGYRRIRPHEWFIVPSETVFKFKIRSLFIKAERSTALQSPYSANKSRAVKIQSFPSEDSGYYVSRFFPNRDDLAMSCDSICGPLLFSNRQLAIVFSHRKETQHSPFAVQFQHMAAEDILNVGFVDEWKTGSPAQLFPNEIENREVGGRAAVPLPDGRAGVVRVRKTPGKYVVNISIERVPSWE